MSDQAQGLRALVHASAATTAGTLEQTAPLARVIAVTSGKGGVGKTTLTCNLGIAMARAGARVVVLDADLGLANVHVLLGISPPCNLEGLLAGGATLAQVLLPTDYGIRVVAGASGVTQYSEMDAPRRERLRMALADLDAQADIVLVDTAAGLAPNVRAFICAAPEVIVVTTPDPTAIADAYATIKVASRENPTARVMLLPNMVGSEREALQVGERLRAVSRRFLSHEIEFLGHVPTDAAVGRAVRAQRPFAVASPSAPAVRAVEAVVQRLGWAAPPRAGGLTELIGRMSARVTGGRGAV